MVYRCTKLLILPYHPSRHRGHASPNPPKGAVPLKTARFLRAVLLCGAEERQKCLVEFRKDLITNMNQRDQAGGINLITARDPSWPYTKLLPS